MPQPIHVEHTYRQWLIHKMKGRSEFLERLVPHNDDICITRNTLHIFKGPMAQCYSQSTTVLEFTGSATSPVIAEFLWLKISHIYKESWSNLVVVVTQPISLIKRLPKCARLLCLSTINIRYNIVKDRQFINNNQELFHKITRHPIKHKGIWLIDWEHCILCN